MFSVLRCMFVLALVAMAPAIPAHAQEATQAIAAPSTAIVIGPESNLPIPRYVSIKGDEANVRRGPSLTHRIDWVFQRRDMPVQVVAEYGHWRRIVDRDGQGGWIHFRLLSGHRTVIIDEDLLKLRSRADAESAEVAIVEAGVVASLDECSLEWCRISTGGYRGWALKTVLWGVDADEVFD